MKNIAAIIALALIIPAFNSCIFDAKKAEKEDNTGPPPAFRDLTERDDVFFNLQLAYNQRNIDEYNKMLDDKFIFNFSAADVSSGNVDVAQWIDYFLTVVAGENTFTSGNPLKSEWTIRQVDDNGTMIWRIISWRDLGEV
jgi:hypothetical protein